MIYQQLINGLMLGASYSLVAIGYTLIFGVLDLLYFAHGEVFMVGAFVGLFLVLYAGANIYVALLGAMIACAMLGVLSVLRRDAAGAEGSPARAADQHDRAHHRAAKSRGLYFRRPAGRRFPKRSSRQLYHVRAGHDLLDADFHPRRRHRADGARSGCSSSAPRSAARSARSPRTTRPPRCSASTSTAWCWSPSSSAPASPASRACSTA